MVTAWVYTNKRVSVYFKISKFSAMTCESYYALAGNSAKPPPSQTVKVCWYAWCAQSGTWFQSQFHFSFSIMPPQSNQTSLNFCPEVWKYVLCVAASRRAEWGQKNAQPVGKAVGYLSEAPRQSWLQYPAGTPLVAWYSTDTQYLSANCWSSSSL